jgi:methylated-DNA-[protein]-cysteine S-methyltransferase
LSTLFRDIVRQPIKLNCETAGFLYFNSLLNSRFQHLLFPIPHSLNNCQLYTLKLKAEVEMLNLYVKEVERVWFGVAFEGEEIFATAFAFSEQGALQSLLGGIPFNVPFMQLEEPSHFADAVVVVLKNVYDGKDVSFNFSLATNHLSTYARQVIETTLLIPVGYVTSYGAIAKTVGGSPRAVGNVMARNPFAPLVPCHRVVCSDFSLGGYGGGLNVKLQILKREKRGYASEREVSLNGKKLLLFPVENVLDKVKEENLTS